MFFLQWSAAGMAAVWQACLKAKLMIAASRVVRKLSNECVYSVGEPYFQPSGNIAVSYDWSSMMRLHSIHISIRVAIEFLTSTVAYDASVVQMRVIIHTNHGQPATCAKKDRNGGRNCPVAEGRRVPQLALHYGFFWWWEWPQDLPRLDRWEDAGVCIRKKEDCINHIEKSMDIAFAECSSQAQGLWLQNPQWKEQAKRRSNKQNELLLRVGT